ncbi:MAG: 30S ribosomal protein S9 [Planctomycetota bacterium]|nr:30S ribosomal protein S9 [Planctomycetota bacterium]
MTTLTTDVSGSTAGETRPLKAPKSADKRGWWWGTGRRKTAVARARLKPASEKDATVIVERTDGTEKTIEAYFTELRDRNDALAPFTLTGTAGKFLVRIKAHGGGHMAQAQAMRLAISRALVGYDPTVEKALRDAGFLSRDAREVERKKYGQAGARRRFQFSKR